MTNQALELTVQVLVEMEDGSEVGLRTREFVEDKIQNLFPPITRDIRAIITIADEHESIAVTKYRNDPTEELRKKAWT